MTHLTASDLTRIREGAATGAEARHLSTCAACAALFPVDESTQALRAAFSEEVKHPDESELAAYVDATLDHAKREAVQEHLRECDLCREDVEDLVRWTAPTPRRWRVHAALAAAAAATIVFAALLLREPQRDVKTRPAPPAVSTMHTPAVARSEWDALVDRVRATRTLPLPSSVSELGARDAWRGAGESQIASGVWPAGTAVERDRPELHWRSFEGATYTVSIIDGAKVVEQSAPLTVARSQPSKPLAQGRRIRGRSRSPMTV
jgi:hypothetical protein